MSSISIPLQIIKGSLQQIEDPKLAIDSALSLLMTTPCFSTPADPSYGFVFNNLRFEIFNEHEGVVYDSAGEDRHLGGREDLYNRRITGASSNLDTFAASLKESIEMYEPRLGNVSVAMSYIREERKIYVTVKGVIVASGKPYQYSTIINVWK
ncbi:MAG: hypothetical protein ILP18_10055 [Treponema sp.]|nr:hypothetical protein [Treponema sp.]